MEVEEQRTPDPTPAPPALVSPSAPALPPQSLDPPISSNPAQAPQYPPPPAAAPPGRRLPSGEEEKVGAGSSLPELRTDDASLSHGLKKFSLPEDDGMD
jgi:hypothetical protein